MIQYEEILLDMLVQNERICPYSLLVPNSYNELLMRRTAFETWSYATDGVMSRLSDYARSRLTGWYVSKYFYKNSMHSFQIKLHLIMKKQEIITYS